jgi:hypothetical protein
MFIIQFSVTSHFLESKHLPLLTCKETRRLTFFYFFHYLTFYATQCQLKCLVHLQLLTKKKQIIFSILSSQEMLDKKH